jgi:trans-2,3-dihydro-3-hydroxyanthranilate isomerase
MLDVREYAFHQVDVFTDRPFGGNPLAVFPHAEGLTGAEMQAIAREMNLSETTFVLPATAPGAAFKVRIFTPGAELPFAGHPVVGTHWVLARLGMVELTEPVTRVALELGVGVLAADLHVREDVVSRVVMTQGRPELLGEIDDPTELAAGLGLDPDAVSETGHRPGVVSTGVPQLMVPVRSLADVRALDAGAMDGRLLGRVMRAYDCDLVMTFCTETEDPDASVHTRGFAHPLGIPEDPATGSANGALGAYVVKHGLVSLDGPTVCYRSEQGIEMGRPSTLEIEVDHEDGEPVTVRVGGAVAPVIEGTLLL